jgi:hypothetical protein
MNKTLSLLIVLMLLLGSGVAQNEQSSGASTQQPSSAAGAQGVQLQPGSLIYAELSKSIDSKKAKAGDPVMAKVTQAVLSRGQIAIPKNSKLIGHLTSAKAHSKDQPDSELGIAFDRAELKNGTQIPLTTLSIQALGGNVGLDQPPSNVANGTGGAVPGPGMSGPHGNTGMNAPTGGTTSNNYPSANTDATGSDVSAGTSTGPSSDSGRLNGASRGVVGISGVKLQSQPQGGVVAASGKNVKLDSGTQMVLRSQ